MRGIRKLLALLLCVCLLLPCVTVGAYAETTASGTCGDNLTWELDDQGTLTVSGTGPMSDYSVDDAPWYENRDQITRVVIQEGVTTVGHCAFEDCAVETVSLPDSLTALEIGAFYSCTHLDSVDIPAGVTSIAHNAFGYSTVTALNVDPANAVYASADGVLFSKDGTTLVTYPAGRPDTSYTIPAGVTAIGESAFYTNRYLTELVIPEGVTTLGPSALRDFRSLPEINLPASISTIGEWALSESRSVTAVNCSENNPDFSSLDGVLFSKDQTRLIVYPAGRPADSYAIPDGVTSIANAAFNTAALLKTVTMPDSVTVLGKNVFSGSCKLEQVTLSANLTEIPWHTFSRCEKLGSIVIPEGVTLIDSFAFRSCSVLADVTIPASVTEIRANAFSACNALADVYYGGTEAQWNQIQIAAAGNARLIVATIHYNGEGPVVDEIAIDETNFPDANFRSYVAEIFDTDGNGALSTAEIAQVDEINVSEQDITSLKGVEYFTALKWLYCYNNQLTTLDVSANTALVDLECGDNQLTSLDVSRNTELTGLYCENNQLTALDISRNTKLLGLDCSNNRLASLDASKCPDIVRLYCSNNQLTMLDVSSNGSLMYLYCQNNRLASLSLSGSPSMWQLSCYGNSIAELDISACSYLLGAFVYGDTYETEVYRAYESEGGESMYIDLTTVVIGVPHTGPEITGQPQDYTGAVGETASFTVEAQGEGLTYQWQYKSLKDGKWYNTTTTGYNTPTMSIKVTNARNGMQFRCKVTGGSTTVTSDAATLRVAAPAVAITSQPRDFTGPLNATATFTVEATGTGLTYQWQYKSLKDGKWYNTTTTGYNTPTMSIKVTSARNGMQFRCKVTGGSTTVTSDAATLRVAAPAVAITSQPRDFTGPLNATATFTVEATGTGLTYQWQYKSLKDGKWYNTTTTGYNTPTMSIAVTNSRNGMQFRCKVTGGGTTVTSDAATLRVGTALAITGQPQDFTGPLNATATFHVEATGTGLTYQWQYKSLKDGKWYNTTVTGYNTPTMSIGVTNSRNGMQFRCVVTDASGDTVTSNAATLRVG